MTTFENYLNQAGGSAVGAVPASSPVPEAIPKGMQQIIDQVIPMIERGTGKPIDKIIIGAAAAMGKGQLESYFRDLIPGIGFDRAPLAKKDQKWVDYAKFIVVWAPLGILGFGGAIVLVIWFGRWLLG